MLDLTLTLFNIIYLHFEGQKSYIEIENGTSLFLQWEDGIWVSVTGKWDLYPTPRTFTFHDLSFLHFESIFIFIAVSWISKRVSFVKVAIAKGCLIRNSNEVRFQTLRK